VYVCYTRLGYGMRDFVYVQSVLTEPSFLNRPILSFEEFIVCTLARSYLTHFVSS
jgi:hypothetical protein